MQQIPYETTNRTLALCLHIGGCRLVDIWRFITPQDLRTHGVTEEQAYRSENVGKVVFYNERGSNLESLLAAYDSVTKTEKLDLPNVTDEDAVRIGHLILQLRGDVTKWLRNPACPKYIEVNGDATIQDNQDGSKTIHHPGLSCRSGNVSKATFQHLKK